MQLEHSFDVPVPVDDAWAVLLDVERIAPCMPGGVLEEVHGDSFSGRVKVKVGPITVTYAGTARFLSKDPATHVVVIDASGKETRGTGTAAATVTATLTPQGTGTRCDVSTDLAITGKPAQFGRGVMADVGGKLIGQFANCLAAEIEQPQAAPPQSPPEPAPLTEATPSEIIEANVPEPVAVALEAEAEAGDAADAADAGANVEPAEVVGAPADSALPPEPAAPPTPGPRKVTQSRESAPIDLISTARGPVLRRLAPAAVAALALVLIVRAVLRRLDDN